MNRFTTRRPTVTLDQIREWRKARHDAGLASGLDDFFVVTGTCRRCQGAGDVLAGSRDIAFAVWPASYKTCPACGGAGCVPPAPENGGTTVISTGGS